MVDFLTTLGVLLSVAAGCVAIIRPVVKLSSTITQLNSNIEKLSADFKENMKKTSDARKRIWEHNGEQDDIIANHEVRIQILEKVREEHGGERD